MIASTTNLHHAGMKNMVRRRGQSESSDDVMTGQGTMAHSQPKIGEHGEYNTGLHAYVRHTPSTAHLDKTNPTHQPPNQTTNVQARLAIGLSYVRHDIRCDKGMTNFFMTQTSPIIVDCSKISSKHPRRPHAEPNSRDTIQINSLDHLSQTNHSTTNQIIDKIQTNH